MQGFAFTIIAAALCCALLATQSMADGRRSLWGEIVVGRQSESERLATIDFQRYISQVTGTVPPVIDVKDWRANPRPAVILGCASTNSLLAGQSIPGKELGAQGYYLANAEIRGVQVTIAAGKTAEGATNAVYGLLRELGYGFYLGSEAIPDSLPNRLPANPVVKQPVFRIRGVLPWYNFFNSPTTWDPIDHRAFVDQLLRQGANFVGFHTYDAEPFGAVSENGKMKWGARLLNTATPTWGSTGLAASDYGFGTDKLYSKPYFGADSTLDIPDADKAIRVEQDIMRDALDYAKSRGLHTCIGFEISGDPMIPEDRDVFLKRFNHLLDQYPSAEYIWLWQPETQGAQGFASRYNQHMLPNTLKAGSPLPRYGLARRDIFHRIVDEAKGEPPFYQNTESGRMARANEGARLEQYSQLACLALSHRTNAPKLVISGWGGDQRLLSAEYYDGLDKLLPKDVVFASLDNIHPLASVDRVYDKLPKNRERWPIPWLELDGDQWQPQPWVHVYEKMVRNAHEGGSQGILGIHWRTRDVEETFGYMMQYAWNPNLTAEGFFRDYASRCYDPAIAKQMADIHTALDNLGYRWVGGAGQVECGSFGWGPGTEDKAKELEALRAQAVSLLPRAGKGRARLKWLIGEMDWVLRFREAEMDATKAEGLLSEAANADPEQARALGQSALAAMDQGHMERAMRAYAERLSTRGEYGVLATANTKAVVAWRNLRARCLKAAGETQPEPETAWNTNQQILLPRLLGSTMAGNALALEPIVFGGGEAWLHYRRLGDTKWTTQPLKPVEGKWTQTAQIPANAIVSPGIEISFSHSSDPSATPAFGPVAVTALPKPATEVPARSIRPIQKDHAIRLTRTEGRVYSLELRWNGIPDADYYRVYRDGTLVCETAVAMLPDSPDQSEASYKVEAIRDNKVIAKSEDVRFVVPRRDIREQPQVQVSVQLTGITLTWPAAKSEAIVSYRISRSPASGPAKQKILGIAQASNHFEHKFTDAPPSGTWIYTVTPLNTADQPGKATEVKAEFVRQTGRGSVLDAPLVSKPAESTVVGSVTFGESGAFFEGGYITFPHDDRWNLGHGLTLAFDFKADSVSAIPVLVCHGQWQGDGWFIQILNGKIVMRTRSGDVMGPDIRTDEWYSVVYVFEHGECQLSIDGMKFGTSQIEDIPTTKDLIIGQYEKKEPTYAFHGTIRNLRIWDEALADGQTSAQ